MITGIIILLVVLAVAVLPISLLALAMIRKKDLRRWMFSPSKSKPYSNIIFWWEIRRIHYNIIMLFFGAVGFFFTLFMVSVFSPSFDFDFFIAIFAGIPMFAIGANILYTGGWVSEIIIRFLWKEKAEHFGPIMWTLGTAFSICVCFLPGMEHFVVWLIRHPGFLRSLS